MYNKNSIIYSLSGWYNKVRIGKKLDKRPCSFLCVFFNTKICFMHHYHLRQEGGDMHRMNNKFLPVTLGTKSQESGIWGELLTSTSTASCGQPQQSRPLSATLGIQIPAVASCAGVQEVMGGSGLGAGMGHGWTGSVGRGKAQEDHPSGAGPHCPQGKSQPWFWIGWVFLIEELFA